MDQPHFIGTMLHIYMLVPLCTKLYMITCVNVEDRGFAKGYSDAFREAEGDDARGGDARDVARDQDQGDANA